MTNICLRWENILYQCGLPFKPSIEHESNRVIIKTVQKAKYFLIRITATEVEAEVLNEQLLNINDINSSRSSLE